MQVIISQKDFEELKDVSLIWTCIEPTIKQIRGKNFTVKSEAYSHLNEGQRALLMFQMLYGHTSGGVEEFYLHLSYLLSNKGVWSQLKKGILYFGDKDMVQILEKMDAIFQRMKTEKFEENAEQYNAMISGFDDNPELAAAMNLLNESFRNTLPRSIELVAAYIRHHAEEFVQFND